MFPKPQRVSFLTLSNYTLLNSLQAVDEKVLIHTHPSLKEMGVGRIAAMGVLSAFIHRHFQSHGYLCQKPLF